MKKLEVHTLSFDGDAKLKSHDQGHTPARDVRVCVSACLRVCVSACLRVCVSIITVRDLPSGHDG